MKNNLDIILGIAGLVAVVYRVFQVEARIYDTIDELHKSLSKRIVENEFNFGVHMAAYAERKERVDYLIHANEEKIDHKANRLFDEIKEIKLWLKHIQESDEN